MELADVSQHSHEIGVVNLPFTRRGRRAQAATKAAVAGSNPSLPPASPSQSGGSCPQPNQTAGQVTSMQTQPEITQAFSSSYPHFPSMSMPIPQGFGAVTQLSATPSVPPPPPVPAPVPTPAQHPFPTPSPNQVVAANERERMDRERWDRMDVLYQNIRNNARQFEYPAASVAALESVLVRMYFESPIPAPHSQPANGPPFTYAPASVPLAHAAPMQQPEQIAVGQSSRSDGTSESEGDEEDEE